MDAWVKKKIINNGIYSRFHCMLWFNGHFSARPPPNTYLRTAGGLILRNTASDQCREKCEPWDQPVQVDAGLVLLPYLPLPQHLLHYFFISWESVPGENVKPAEHQHAQSGPHRQLAPVASHQHLSLLLLSVPRTAQIHRRMHIGTARHSEK